MLEPDIQQGIGDAIPSNMQLLSQGVMNADALITNFFHSPNAASQLGTIYETNEGASFIEAWEINTLLDNFNFQILTDASMHGVSGSYSKENGTVYVSESLVKASFYDRDLLTGVIIEEIGHGIDAILNNEKDTAGDEGELFKSMVLGVNLSANNLLRIQNENDFGTVEVDGKLIQVEQSSTLKTGMNLDGRMEFYAVGSDNVIYHRYQAVKDGGFSAWSSTGLTGKEVEIGQSVDGRMEVYAIGLDNNVWHQFQQSPNSTMTTWANLGQQATEIKIGKNQDGRLEAFILGTDSTISHRWQTQAGSSTWSAWTKMDGTATDIEVAKNQDGRMEFFAIGTDSVVKHRWQQGVNQAFGAWVNMGVTAKSIDVGTNADGRMEAFIITKDGRLKNNWQSAPNKAFGSTWTDLEMSATKVEVARNTDGRNEIFAIQSDQQVFRRYQSGPNSGLTNWINTNLKAVEIETGVNASGRMEIFALDNKGVVRHQFQSRPSDSTSWGTWFDMGNSGRTFIAERSSTLYSPVASNWIVTSGYAMRDGKFHYGLDLSTQYSRDAFGKPAASVSAGKILKVAWEANGFGNYVVVDHGNGITSYYAHLSEVDVKVGDLVNQGTTVGKVGSTGNSTGPHLHFAMKLNGTWVNPTGYVKF
jgi:murein DD-endopeptidase MepM/ murein hydrolase activator NlpD